MVKPTPSRRPKNKARPNTDEPVFAQPQPSPDPTTFKDPVTDQNYTEIANLEPAPQPVGVPLLEPILTLAQTYGSAGDAKAAAIQQAKQIVFHSVGDTGSVIGPDTQSLVADKMVSDFDEANSADVPPYKLDDTLTLESYDDTDYGYLRVVVNALTLTIELHPESDGGVTKTPDDTVTVNLQTRAIS